MNITEEQNIGNEHKAEDAGNTHTPTKAPSAKKVYSKPVLHVLLQPHDNQGNKRSPFPGEGSRAGKGISYSPS